MKELDEPTLRPLEQFDTSWLVDVLALAALYFLTARLGLLMAIPGGHVTPVWPPSGIALAAVLLRGRRMWPGIWLGSFAANLWDFCDSPMSLATDLATSATFGIGASLTALLGSQLLRRFVGEHNPLKRVRDVCAFMALGGVVSCLVSATIGVTTLSLAGFAPWSGYDQAWLTWWLGDTAGVFIVAPLLLVWGGARRPKSAARWVELFVGFGLLIAVTYYVFIRNTGVLFTAKPLAFTLIPFLVWSAVRFGRRGAAAAAGLIALLAVWGTIHGSGAFNLGSRNESLLVLELFLSVISLTALCIAAVVTERRNAESNRRRVLDELESRVAERTASLDQANAALLADITERKQAESALRQLAQVSAASSDYIALIGRDFRYQFVNDTYLKARGLHLEDIIGRHMKEIVGQERFEQLGRPQVEACLRGEEIESFEWTDFRPDLRCFLHVKVAPLREPDGTISGAVMSGRDITARREAEQAQRESEERFRELAENIDDIFWLSDPQHKEVLYISPAYERIWGRTRASLYASPRSWTEALHPEDRERILALRADDCPQAKHEMTYRIVRPDGSLRWIHQREFPVKDAEGKIVRVAGIVEDITERKRVELALDERLRFETLLTELSAAFANLPTTIVDQEIDKWLQNLVEFLDLDRAIFDQVGEDGMTLLRTHSHTARGIDTRPLNVANNQAPWITEQLLRGNTVKWSRIPDDIPEQASKEKAFARRIGAKSVLSIPVCIGGSVICAVSFTSMRNYRNWTDEMVARLRLVGEIFANAIARKRAEEALFRREGELNEAQRLASIGSWEWDILTDGLTYSDELRRIYGFEREDLSSPDRLFSEAVHPDDRARRSAVIAAALDGGPPYNVEFRIIRPDKSTRLVHSRGRLIRDEAGRPVRMFGMAQDITEGKEAEEAIRKVNRQLQILSRRRIQMQEEERRHLARELHDQIGQLLTAGNINLQSARKTRDRRAATKKLDETIAILEQILQQVRQISFDIRPPVLDDLGLAPAMRWMLDDTVARAGLTAEFFADPNLKRGDLESETACYRVGLEAVSNVVRHAQARKIWVELRNAVNALELIVRDNGVGFDVADAAIRVRRDRLGLVGMRERATAVGGRFECKSARGRGTEIRASFPISSKRDESNPL